MAIDTNRALLDQLMGEGRDVKAEERYKSERKFYDKDVDKMFLCGCSPYELFKNTKSDVGNNPYIPDPNCKEQWDKLSQREKDKYGYDYETHQYLEKLSSKLQRQVERNRRRVLDDEEMYVREIAEQVVAIENGISRQLEEVKELARKGEVEKAYAIINTIKASESEKEKLMLVPAPERRHIVCPTSGNLISTADTDERLKAHFEGKQYTGWKKVNIFLEKYRKDPPPRPSSSHHGKSSSSYSRRDYDSRGHDRDRNRSGSYRSSHSRSRTERERHRERESRYNRSRETERRRRW